MEAEEDSSIRCRLCTNCISQLRIAGGELGRGYPRGPITTIYYRRVREFVRLYGHSCRSGRSIDACSAESFESASGRQSGGEGCSGLCDNNGCQRGKDTVLSPDRRRFFLVRRCVSDSYV